MQADPGITPGDTEPRPVTVKDCKTPIRTFVSRFVDSLRYARYLSWAKLGRF